MSRFVLITGCSSGIGLAAAKALGQHGYTVIASARKAEDVAQLRQLGLLAVELDLANEASIEQGAVRRRHWLAAACMASSTTAPTASLARWRICPPRRCASSSTLICSAGTT